jgi:peptidoglycan/LPS O-acetylase OafA/YrhL
MKDEIAGQHAGPVKRAHRFPVLDALRGVAALAVVTLHGRPYFRWVLFPHVNLAVDFFFMLSGFVLTLAYQRRLDDGWRMREFMTARVIRLYPMYALALAIAAGSEFLRVVSGGKGMPLEDLAVLLLLGVVMLPVPPVGVGALLMAFPLNFPSWSLFSELMANVLHAGFLRRRGIGFLLGTVFVAGLLLLGIGIHLGTVNVGTGSRETLYAIVRVMMAYTMGMLLFRLWKSGWVRIPIPAVMVAILLMVVMAVPPVRYGIAYDMGATLLAFPVLLLAGAQAKLTERMTGVATALGQASYAVYVLHVPMAGVLRTIWSKVLRRDMEHDAPWSGLVYLVVVFGLALWLDRVYDTPVRAWLQRRFVKKQSARAGA